MLQLAKQQLTVYLDPDLVARIEAMIMAGVYANASQAVEEALVIWQSALDQREFELELKKVYERGLAQNGRGNVNAASFLRALGDLA